MQQKKIVSYYPLEYNRELYPSFCAFKNNFYFDGITPMVELLVRLQSQRYPDFVDGSLEVILGPEKKGGSCVDYSEYFYAEQRVKPTREAYCSGIDREYSHCFFAIQANEQLIIHDPLIFTSPVEIGDRKPRTIEGIAVEYLKSENMVILETPVKKHAYILKSPDEESGRLISPSDKQKLIYNLALNDHIGIFRDFEGRKWKLKISIKTSSIILDTPAKKWTKSFADFIQEVSLGIPNDYLFPDFFNISSVTVCSQIVQLIGNMDNFFNRA